MNLLAVSYERLMCNLNVWLGAGWPESSLQAPYGLVPPMRL